MSCLVQQVVRYFKGTTTYSSSGVRAGDDEGSVEVVIEKGSLERVVSVHLLISGICDTSRLIVTCSLFSQTPLNIPIFTHSFATLLTKICLQKFKRLLTKLPRSLRDHLDAPFVVLFSRSLVPLPHQRPRLRLNHVKTRRTKKKEKKNLMEWKILMHLTTMMIFQLSRNRIQSRQKSKSKCILHLYNLFIDIP